VINTVHFDHMRVLGNELPAIARHKAGIIKPGVPVVVGQVPDIALGVIWDEARRNGARLVQVGETVHFQVKEIGPQGSRFSYQGLELSLDDLQIGMLGAHQVENAATALASVEVYAGQAGIDLDEGAIRAALRSARFAGRLELMSVAPTVVLDGAHNEEKMAALTAAIEPVFGGYDRLIVVLGMLDTKAAQPIVEKLAHLSDVMITTYPRVLGKPAIGADALADLAREAGVDAVEAVEEPLDALHRALEIAEPGDLVVVTGSLYLIGTVREHWHTAAEIVARRTMFPNGHP
jgi:dihydrofolate synthase/folylpolyglutamate synthase